MASPFYFDLAGSGAYNQTSVEPGAKVPVILQFGAGFTLGYMFSSGLLLGLSSDMRYMNQYSEVTPQVENRQGKRFNSISPTIGFKGKTFLVKADYQIMGDYELTGTTMGGEGGFKYSSPSGGRISIQWCYTGNVWIGIMAESIMYKESNMAASAAGDGRLTSQQFGSVITYVFKS